MTEDLIDALSMTPNLRVRPRGMVARYTGRDVDPREAGRALGVEAVVEASLRRTPTGVRLSARLLGVADGFQLWARRFDCAFGELLVASDEAARAIAEALASRLDGPARKAPTDGSAVEAYLRARESLRRNWYVPSATEPITLFREALQRAPDDPLILAGFAMARARKVGTSVELAEARALAERAVAAAPHLGEPWTAMATVQRHGRDAVGQIASLARALRVAPLQAEAHYQLARLLLEVGPIELAISKLELAASLDTRNDEIRAYLALARLSAGDSLGAEAALHEDTDGSAKHLFPVMRWRKRLWERRSGASSLAPAARGRVYTQLVDDALAGRPPSAVAEAELERAIPRPGLVPQLLAELRFAMGDVEAGVAYATKSVDAGLTDLVWFGACPLLEAAREHPAWAGLEGRVAERAKVVRDALAREGL